MPTKSRSKNSKLGHDPLAWMGDQQGEEQGSETVRPADDAVVENTAVDQADPPGDSTPPEADAGILRLPDRFGIAQVDEMIGRMRQSLSNNIEVIEVHGENVEAIDAAAVQLLISFFAEASSNERKVDFSRYSSKIDEIADLLNLRQALRLE